MEFIKEYLRIVSYSLLGLVFAFASFYLLANLYHYLEIRKDFIADFSNQSMVVSVDDSLNKIKSNITKFNPNKYNGNIELITMNKIKTNLDNCINSIDNDQFKELKTKKRINILDVYKLRESYEDKVYNTCIVNNLYWLTENAPSGYLKNNEELTKYYFEALKSSTSYLKKDLINNSSYFYNTSVASTTVKDDTKDGYYEVMEAYNKAANYVLYLSEWFNKEVEAQHD